MPHSPLPRSIKPSTLECRNPAAQSITPIAACTSIAYRRRLADRDITISMSRPGNPFDNAKAESFMKTLKTEEIDGKAFADVSDERRRIHGFIAEVYDKNRLHSALGYQTPLEFETAFAQKNHGKTTWQPHRHRN